MFERRLKIFLAILIFFVLVLLARAMELQVIQRSYWQEQAAKSLRDEHLLPTTRGRILDRKGNVLAVDEPCLDACVDYRIISADEKFIKQMAMAYIKANEYAQYRTANTDGKKKLLDDQIAAINLKIQHMWLKLAQLSGQPADAIEETRQNILDRVQLRRREVWHHKIVNASQDKSAETKDPWYRKWLTGQADDGSQMDEADFKLDEEVSSHVILEAIDKETQNELSKHSDDYPGLDLRPAMHRKYPYGAVACHVIGHLGRVTREDLQSQDLDVDELRGYKPNDIIGRDGLESLGEPTLRGTRGVEEVDGISGKVTSTTPAQQGSDLKSTIDVDLQQQIEQMFEHVKIPYTNTRPILYDTIPMHGAAVVVEVATGNVLAMVSAPGFDPNYLDEQYPNLVTDNLNKPLLNRATQDQLEPGSTVKPMVGLGAITQGVLGPTEGIPCTGYLIIDGKRYSGFGKCWTVATCKANGIGDPSGHPIPYPHQGRYGNPNGSLCYSDALERSCNVFFETTASRLGASGLTHWLGQFGLGRPTGVGIAEACGMLPDEYKGPNTQFMTWTSGIGQSYVHATPIQMANVAATIARRGIWVRPNLVDSGEKVSPFKPRGVDPNDDRWSKIPDRMDLQLSPEGLNQAFDGMKEVVNGEAGTGTTAFRADMIVAGKTGTAQAAPFFVPKSDGNNGLLRDENGKYIMEALTPSTHTNPNKEHPWYRATDEEGKKLNHAWFIGFMPADSPKYAISVMVEYGGGGGGVVAGPIASQIIDALIEHGYLAPTGEKHSYPMMP